MNIETHQDNKKCKKENQNNLCITAVIIYVQIITLSVNTANKYFLVYVEYK